MVVLFLATRTLLVIFIALNLKSTSWRLIACSFIVALLAADFPLTYAGNRKVDYLLGATLGSNALQAVRFLLLLRPLEEYRHEADKVPAYQLPFIQRCFWLFKMINSQRGIGWSFQARSLVLVDRHHRTRASFIASRLRWLFSHYLLMEVATLYMRCNPVFLSTASVTSQGNILQCLNVAAIPFQLSEALICIHSALAILAVGAGFDEPQAWPQPFGHWKNAYTIRKFWGKTWHQFARHDLTLFAPYRPKRNPWNPAGTENSSVTKQVEHEPWATKYRRLCQVFIYSALMHCCGDIVLQFREWADFSPTSASGTMDVPNVIGYSAPFFLLQPVGVLLEDAATEVGKRMGLKEGTWIRRVGYAWVWVFTSFSLVISVDGLKNAARAGEGMGVRVTLIEIIADCVFGVQLAPMLSSWLSRM